MNDRIKREAAIRRMNEKSRYSTFPTFKHTENDVQKNEKYRAFADLDQNTLIKQLVELEQVFNFHRSVMQSIQTGIITLDMGGVITFANRPASEILECSIESLLNSSIEAILPEFDFGHALANMPIKGKEFLYSVNTSSKLSLRVNLESYTDEANKHTGLIMSVEDISEIHELRSKMTKMEHLVTLGEVSKGIAHELRNPLAGAKSISEVLASTFEDNISIRDFTSRIAKEINRANQLLSEFFRYAKPERPKPSLVDSEAFVEKALLYISNRGHNSPVRVTTNFGELAPHFYADEKQLEQVLEILLENALDALSLAEKPEIHVVVKPIERQTKNGRKSWVQIELQNNGQSIDISDSEKIFNPFFSTKVKNVGLGLSIASRLVEENNGMLTLNSEFTQGTSFILLLPTS